MKTKQSYYTSIGLVIGILLVINILSADLFVRLDLTENGRYTLSRATKDILHELVEPVTVKAYFSDNLPPNIQQTRTDLRDMLVEYASLSDGNLVYEFVNPSDDPTIEQEINQNGINPIMINVREKDQMKQQKAYMGVMLQLGEGKEIIPFVRPGEAMEYALTSSIKKLAVVDKPSVALIQGHGEPAPYALQQVGELLGVLYNLESYTMTDTTNIPDALKAIAIVAPTDSFPQTHLRQLDAFLERGGNILVALNRVEGNLNQGVGSSVNTGLEEWLSSKGIHVDDKFLIDANSSTIGIRQQQGFFSFTSSVVFPFFPILTSFEDHPISGGLEAVSMQFASPISFEGDTSISYMPLVKSSELSGLENTPTYFNVEKEWVETDFPLSGEVVAAAFEGKLSGESRSKMVVIGDADFALNLKPGAQQAQPQPEDNIGLFVNSMDWLSDDTGLIELRTKGVSSRPLDQLEDTQKTLLKYVNFLLPIILILIYGLVRAQLKRNQRIKRMEGSYA